MLDFAQRSNEGFIRLRDVAERQGISKTYLEQIMLMLNKTDFFVTARGYRGGYQLARSPESYGIGEILRVTEGGIGPTDALECQDPSIDRRVSAMVDDVWKGLGAVMADYLDGITLQDLLDRHVETPGFDFCI
jgi:Rrf2 family protein